MAIELHVQRPDETERVSYAVILRSEQDCTDSSRKYMVIRSVFAVADGTIFYPIFPGEKVIKEFISKDEAHNCAEMLGIIET